MGVRPSSKNIPIDKRGFNNGVSNNIPKSIFGPPPTKNQKFDEQLSDDLIHTINEKAAMADEISAMRKKLEALTKVSFSEIYVFTFVSVNQRW